MPLGIRQVRLQVFLLLCSPEPGQSLLTPTPVWRTRTCSTSSGQAACLDRRVRRGPQNVAGPARAWAAAAVLPLWPEVGIWLTPRAGLGEQICGLQGHCCLGAEGPGSPQTLARGLGAKGGSLGQPVRRAGQRRVREPAAACGQSRGKSSGQAREISRAGEGHRSAELRPREGTQSLSRRPGSSLDTTFTGISGL